MRSWLYLLLAIGSEVIGTSSIKLFADHSSILSYTIMYGFISFSYYFLSKAVRKVPVGVAYALWEGIGIVLISIISVMWFGEHLGFYKVLGLALIIVGVLFIKSGTKAKPMSLNSLKPQEA